LTFSNILHKYKNGWHYNAQRFGSAAAAGPARLLLDYRAISGTWVEPAVSHRRPQDRFADAAVVRGTNGVETNRAGFERRSRGLW